MKRINVDPWNLKINPFSLLGKRWMVLASGDFGKNDYNMMLVAWGSFGVMWHKPFVHVVVRPNRYTNEFMEKYDSFTLSLFPEDMRSKIKLMGQESGRTFNKKGYEHLTISKSECVKSPGFNEAEMVFECRKNYVQSMDPAAIPNEIKDNIYPQNDFHISYFGEIVNIEATKEIFDAGC